MDETDLPCSDCSVALTERTADVAEQQVAVERSRSATVAECPSCSATCYPERALARLSGETNGAPMFGEG